jgi:hypothetical protein
VNQPVNGHEPEEATAPAGRDDDPPAPSTGTSGWFLRAAAFVGDLTSPFYDEERQRDVWNEASAVGLQFLFWSGLVAATAMVWIGGGPAVPYALILFLLVGLAALVTLEYARRHGVEAVGTPVGVPPRRALRRAAPVLTIQIVFWTGVVLAVDDLRTDAVRGWGIGVALGAAAATVVRRRRRGQPGTRDSASQLDG